MTLSHTILACLVNSPHSGYDLNKSFQESVGCFWQASQQQIYRELSKMEQKNWLTGEIVPQEGKPDKKLYHITDLGREELIRWLEEPTKMSPIREDLLVKLLAGYLLPREELIEKIERRKKVHQQQLKIYEQKQAEEFVNLTQLPKPKQFLYLTLLRGINIEKDWIDWCNQVLNLLKNDFNS